jgi:hypothetical protein
MFIKTTRHVNARTLDGRVYAAGEGTVTQFDDDDEGMVAMAEALVASGQAELYVDEPAPVTEDEAAAEDEWIATIDATEIGQLRADAEAAGVKVDRRWGADRLREEISAAQEDSE